MPILRSLDGRAFDIDEQTLAKYRIPDEQVKKLVGNYALPPAPPPAAQPATMSGIDLQVPESMKGQVTVERGPGNTIVINLGGSPPPRNPQG